MRQTFYFTDKTTSVIKNVTISMETHFKKGRDVTWIIVPHDKGKSFINLEHVAWIHEEEIDE